MNNFAEIIFVQKNLKVTYYSITINGDDALYDQFIEQQTIKTNK